MLQNRSYKVTVNSAGPNSSFFFRFITIAIEPFHEAFETVHRIAACSFEWFVVVLFPKYCLECPKSTLKKQT